jgi:3-deoxy-D-manno-octulosonate 8-phosphate phosphatase (KDO 8-P phosphatase)
MIKYDIPDELRHAAQRVRLLLLDCDGVLTDGRLYFGESGEALKAFDVRDGLGIVRWHEAGFASGIISGRGSPIVERRASELRMRFVRQSVNDKMAVAAEIFAECGISAEEAIYVGDDLPDIDLMRAVGLGVAVADAAAEARDAALYITRSKGGRGAVRELIDLILSAKS